MKPLLPVGEAQRQLLALAAPVETETVPVSEAAGRWLAEPLRAKRTQPDSDLSAMDGYALRFEELGGPLKIVGESAAGAPFNGSLGRREAVRIFTGAVVPEGADCILIQEEARREDHTLTLAGDGPDGAGAHIRRAGEDFATGDAVIEPGVRLTPNRIALAIAAGHGEVTVRRKLRITLVSTGDELRTPGAETPRGTLPASNGPMLAAMLAASPVAIDDLGIVPDTLEAIGKAIAKGAKSDILVTIGGASVGDHDLVRPALDTAGAELAFWRIAMKPGKPLLAGRLGDTVVLGLPGNPASAFVTAKLFLDPLIAALSGATDPMPRLIDAALGSDLPATGIRAEYLRGTWSDGKVVAVATQSSAALSSLGAAELLIERRAESPPAKSGETIRILPVA